MLVAITIGHAGVGRPDHQGLLQAAGYRRAAVRCGGPGGVHRLARRPDVEERHRGLRRRDRRVQPHRSEKCRPFLCQLPVTTFRRTPHNQFGATYHCLSWTCHCQILCLSLSAWCLKENCCLQSADRPSRPHTPPTRPPPPCSPAASPALPGTPSRLPPPLPYDAPWPQTVHSLAGGGVPQAVSKLGA